MNTALNNKEKQLVQLIKDNKTSAFWMDDAKKIIAEGLNWKIRRLFAELKSQRMDNVYLMRQIIGQEANDLLGAI